MLRRARVQDPLAAHAHRAARSPRHLEHAGGARHRGGSEAAHHLREDPAAPLLPARHRDRPARDRAHPRPGRSRARGHGEGQDQARGRDREDRAPAAGRARALLRAQVPVPEARPARGARVLGRRDGEPGRDHLPRGAPAAGPEAGDRRGAPPPRHHHGARAGAHVVRRSRHHGVVGRHLAQRVVRLVDGRQGEPRGLSRVRSHRG